MMRNLTIASLIFFAACANITEQKQKSPLYFGSVDGDSVFLYYLVNSKNDTVKITNYGATVTHWITADKNGKTSSVVLGFDSLQGYLNKPPYFGSTIGRYGNRIAHGKFTLDSVEYTLATNNGPNHLHGGNKGFDKVVWSTEKADDREIVFSYESKDGEEGYPGNLNVRLIYTLTDNNELKINYYAGTDKPTIVNLTNHSYFNLTGDPAVTVLDHRLMIAASAYTPVDSTLIPTGELKQVAGTPFDFTKPVKIGTRIAQVPGGYDHNFVLNRQTKQEEKIAELSDDLSGRKLEVFTTEPGLQFYSGNFLDGSIKSSNNIPFEKHAGLCLETQHYPNSPNVPAFPTTVLRPGVDYHTQTTYKISLIQ